MNPQIYGYFLEKALAAALSTFTPRRADEKIVLAHLLTVLCKPQDTNALMSLILQKTTTLARAPIAPSVARPA